MDLRRDLFSHICGDLKGKLRWFPRSTVEWTTAIVGSLDSFRKEPGQYRKHPRQFLLDYIWPRAKCGKPIILGFAHENYDSDAEILRDELRKLLHVRAATRY